MSDDSYFIAAPHHRPIRIGALGMDQRQRNAFRLLFASKCLNRYTLVEGTQAEIYLLDLDVFGGERLWSEFRNRSPRSPLIVLSINPRKAEDSFTLFVQKPVIVENLIEAVERQRNELLKPEEQSPVTPSAGTAPTEDKLNDGGKSSPPPSVKMPRAHLKPSVKKAASLLSGATEQAFVGTAPDINPADRSHLSKIYYNPDHYLQGHFLKALEYAKRSNSNVTLSGPWPTIYLLIEHGIVRVEVNERQFRPYCTLPNDTQKISLRVLRDRAYTAGRSSAYQCSVTAFLWQLALWASRGRLPEGTDINQPIHLMRWPNFTRIAVTPHALAVAALWAKGPCSLIDTAEMLYIPQRYVFAFYSAAHALQLVQCGSTQSQQLPPVHQPLRRSRNRGTLGRLLGYLRGHRSNPTLTTESKWH
ncbi:MAG: hypothetical protein P8166_17200 [Candidatus Thiodiazotropha sp.]